MGAFFWSTAWAGPPKDAERVMKPYPSICTPTLESLVGAMVEDYAVHVSISFQESPISYVMIVENPDTKSMAVIHINVDGRACLVFSGLQVQRFERPEGMAPPKVDINESFDGADT
jgi:hypothetical protein